MYETKLNLTKFKAKILALKYSSKKYFCAGW